MFESSPWRAAAMGRKQSVATDRYRPKAALGGGQLMAKNSQWKGSRQIGSVRSDAIVSTQRGITWSRMDSCKIYQKVSS